MGDSELEAIRQRRMQQMMAQQGMQGMGGGDDAEAAAAKREAAEEQRGVMLHAVMQPEARARLSRIALVKPDKARAVENMILASAQRGQITEKISEERLVSMLEQISEKEGAAKKITITRRRPAFSDEDD